jgi:hypothetical protein
MGRHRQLDERELFRYALFPFAGIVSILINSYRQPICSELAVSSVNG